MDFCGIKELGGLLGLYQFWEFDVTAKKLLDAGKTEEAKALAIRSWQVKNILPDVYGAVVAYNINNDAPPPANVNSLKILYLAFGTAVTTPTASNTQLGTEVFRKMVASRTTYNRTAKMNLILDFADANGNTLKEIGAFAGNATGTANSGVLGSHTLMVPQIVKTVEKSYLIEFSITHSSG